MEQLLAFYLATSQADPSGPPIWILTGFAEGVLARANRDMSSAGALDQFREGKVPLTLHRAVLGTKGALSTSGGGGGSSTCARRRVVAAGCRGLSFRRALVLSRTGTGRDFF